MSQDFYPLNCHHYSVASQAHARSLAAAVPGEKPASGLSFLPRAHGAVSIIETRPAKNETGVLPKRRSAALRAAATSKLQGGYPFSPDILCVGTLLRVTRPP
jgi:hypothetical protein